MTVVNQNYNYDDRELRLNSVQTILPSRVSKQAKD